jgi:hypothetical protein
MAQKALEPLIVRIDLGRTGEGLGQDREIDGLDGVKSQQEAHDEFDARPIPG